MAVPSDEFDECLAELILRIEAMLTFAEKAEEPHEVVDAHAAVRVYQQREVDVVAALRRMRRQKAADAVVVPDFVGDDLLVGSHCAGLVEKAPMIREGIDAPTGR